MADQQPCLGPALSPPSGLTNRWRYYSDRYGVIHAAFRFLATRLPVLWPMLGPWVTRGYRMRWRSKGAAKVLNLGGGGNCLAGCLTADIDPRADVYVDLLQPLPFDDNEIDHIFCEEAIEHVDKAAALRLLRECQRVLKPGGLLRVTTPDLNWLISALASADLTCDGFNECFYGHGHRYIYTQDELAALLTQAGFTSTRVSSYQDEASVLGLLDSHADRFRHPPELSQYQEAVK